MQQGKKPLPYMQNRELSWLEFNKRVLDQGEDRNVPLLERLTRISIFGSNLQEFFMVRVGSLTDLSFVKKEIRENKTLMTPDEQLDAIYERCHELYPEQERIFHKILDQLGAYGIKQLLPKELNEEQAEYLHAYLQNQVVPFLSPQIINSRHPFPHLENGALYVLLRLDEERTREKVKESSKNKKKAKNVGADDATFGLVPLPRQANRVIKLPGEGFQFILLENALKTIVDEIFSMYITKRASVICVTRNADIDANDGVDDIDYDYREHMKRILKKRARLAPVRLESDLPLSAVTEKFLLSRLELKPHQVFITDVPLDMDYAWGLYGMVSKDLQAELTPKPFSPTWPACLDRRRPIIEQVCEHDVLLSYPYESMDPFVTMLREAANDPSVLSIKITLYRLASQSHLAEALLAAAENGKEVTALFELRARFDEFNNIEWSQRFEQAGANVIYGFHDFKVHSKICVITRHTDQGLQHITQLGTGNYNEKTSRLYTDFSYITTDESIGKDAAEFFRNMGLENTSDNYRTLSVAPLQIKPMILNKIDEQIALAQEGKPNGVVFKSNSVTDKEVIDKIAEASQAGVEVTLFIRGISCIIPGVEGYTDNVKVVSIVGRLLEHSRIYGFGPHDDMEIYLASADLMTRNMDKRIEIAWPIRNPELKAQIVEYLDISLSDTAKLRMLKSDKTYTPLEYFADVDENGQVDSFDSQEYLIKKAREDYEMSLKEKEEEQARRSAKARAQRLLDEELIPHVATVKVQEEAEATPVVEEEAPVVEEEAPAVEAVEVTEEPVVEQAAAEETPAAEVVEAAAEPVETTEEPVAETPTETIETTEEPAVEEATAEQTPAAEATEEPVAEAPTKAVEVTTEQATAEEVVEQTAPVAEAPVAEVVQEPAQQAAPIQLVEKKQPRAGLLARLKFLFTGRL